MHLELNLPIIAEVAVKQLCVGIEGYPLRIPLPDGKSTGSEIGKEGEKEGKEGGRRKGGTRVRGERG